MGLSPRQVDEMTYWEFMAAVDAFSAFHGSEPPVLPPTDEEFFAMTGQPFDG